MKNRVMKICHFINNESLDVYINELGISLPMKVRKEIPMNVQIRITLFLEKKKKSFLAGEKKYCLII